MKNLKYVLLVVILILTGSSAFADTYKTLRVGGTAKVLEVLDGETLKVEMLSSKDVALVRMAGVDAEGFNGAVGYLNNEIVGRTVNLVFETGVTKHDGRFNIMYVYRDSVLVNRQLVEKGFAKVDVDQKGLSMYAELSQKESESKTAGLGLWKPNGSLKVPVSRTSNIVYTGNGANINTATYYQLTQMLLDVPTSVINEIIYYRDYSPFNSVKDLKFVEGFTKEMFDRNKSAVTVSTNINTATERELRTLKNFSETDIIAVINHRTNKGFIVKKDLTEHNIISASRYTDNEPYIDIMDHPQIDYAIPNLKFDLNTVTQSELQSCGMNYYDANALVNYRKSYSYKTLDELERVPNLTLSKRTIDRFVDNLKVEPLADGVNINTATLAQLKSVGFSDAQAENIFSHRGSMYSITDVPAELAAFDKKLALFTNINTASKTELQSLSTEITDDLIKQIIEYRDDQPFGSRNEIRQFFSEKDKLNVYDQFYNFVVVR